MADVILVGIVIAAFLIGAAWSFSAECGEQYPRGNFVPPTLDHTPASPPPMPRKK
ncbi:MAG: hypothetical protein JWM36_1845 [Hyphomicrobiales bacterium]|nr:hypothetical protein [Hyphomicrobiales bacterium]